MARRRGEPLTDADAARLAELRHWRRAREDALRSARDELRQALGDGDLPSDRMLTDSGRLAPVRPEEWRTDAGLRAMETGRLRLGRSFPYNETPVMISKAAFEAWLRTAGKPDLAPSSSAIDATAAAERRLAEWLTGQMRTAPNAPRSKANMEAAARALGHRFSKRGFVRAWTRAIEESGAVAWSRPGANRRRKIESPR
jgi:hypothetical protein